ncbi:MAG TPA: cytochrome c biogenesis CcdA family protein [Streptosporangiaceae bacterium]|nr:cytochrome c biogenesis CcdA family protein [Streptosporangiaceae bacterium]
MGGGLLTSGSVLAAFFAGGVALFAPCCIVFLAPGYLALAAKNHRWRLLPLTFVFTMGLSLVLVPITLGISLVAATIARFHAPLYYGGGVLMFALAGLALSGRMWSMPAVLRAPDTRRGDSASFFAFGVFSGIASSCCAPVLAGVMTLSALSGSPVGGLLLGLAYVFGMVFPLLVMALAWDRFRLGDRRPAARTVRLRIGGYTLVTNTVNLAVAAAFAAMGGFVIYLAGAERMTGGPGFQVAAGRLLDRVFRRIETWTAPVPEPILGLALLALVAVFAVAVLRDHRSDRSPESGTASGRGEPAAETFDTDQASGPDGAGDIATSGCHTSRHPSDRPSVRSRP